MQSVYFETETERGNTGTARRILKWGGGANCRVKEGRRGGVRGDSLTQKFCH